MVDILSGQSVKKVLLKLSLPAVAAMLVQALYNVVDTIFIGQGVGTKGIAAMTIVFPYLLLLMSFGGLLGIGASSIFARAIGRKDEESAVMTLSSATFYGAILGVVIFLFTYFAYEPISYVFGATPELIPLIKPYIQISAFGMVFLIPGIVLGNLTRTQGAATTAMVTNLIGAITNLILDPLLIFGFHMGMAGAALATITGQIVFCLCYVYLFLSKKLEYVVDFRYLLGKWSLFKEMIYVGFPSLFRQSYNSILMMVCNLIISNYGTALDLAIYGIVGKIAAMQVYPAMGIGQGMMPVAGFHFSAEHYEKVKTVYKTAVRWGTSINGIMALLFTLFGGMMLRLFSSDPMVIETGRPVMWITQPTSIFIAIQILSGAFAQALGNGRLSLILTLARPTIMILFILIAAPFIGVYAIWFGFPLSDLIGGTLAGWIIERQMKKIGKLEERKPNI